jgi:hypothetical protein
LNYTEKEYNNIIQFLHSFKGDINIIEDIIDVNIQLQYFNEAKELKSLPKLEKWEEEVPNLFDDSIDLEEKKKILIRLAAIDDVKAYRFIENYSKGCPSELKEWSLLALQESRILLQSKLLEQPQLLISTGLGGKEGKLRYFFVLFSQNKQPYTAFQKKIISNELSYIFQNNDVNIENMQFFDSYVTIVALFPLFISIAEIIEKALSEINQYGNFVNENCIITNVKLLNNNEIEKFFEENALSDNADRIEKINE